MQAKSRESRGKKNPIAFPEQGHLADGPSLGWKSPVTWHRACHQGRAKLLGWKHRNIGLDLIKKMKFSRSHDLQHNLQCQPGVNKSWKICPVFIQAGKGLRGASCPFFLVLLPKLKEHWNILLWVRARAGWGCCKHHSLRRGDLLLWFKWAEDGSRAGPRRMSSCHCFPGLPLAKTSKRLQKSSSQPAMSPYLLAPLPPLLFCSFFSRDLLASF